MNEASYRAFAQFYSDDTLANEIATHTDHAAFGRKIQAERAAAKEAARIKPGDTVTDGDLTGIVLRADVNSFLVAALGPVKPGYTRIAVQESGIVRQVRTQACRKVAA